MTKKKTNFRARRSPRDPSLDQRAPKANAQVQTLVVADVAFGGDGIAREDGKVIFIEQAVPGETVTAEILQDKKRFARARKLTTLIPAPDAVEPFCPVFGRCGGCDWQHVPYSKQLDWKRQFIESALSKNARFTWHEPISVWPSVQTQNFRNRIKLKARLYQGRLEVAYFAKSSHEIVTITQCPIAETAINEFLLEVKDLPFDVSASWRGELEIQRVGLKQRLLHFDPEFPQQKFLQKHFPNDFVQPTDSVLLEEHEGLSYRTRAGQFQQVNALGNHQLRAWIKTKVVQTGAKTLVDLFCGSGNLSLSLQSISAIKVWGIEYSETAIRTAKENAKDKPLQNFAYKAGPANQIREIFPDIPESVDCVITDPPRAGMDDSIADLLGLKPKHILSVSCDPNTFARDLKILLENGYVLKEILGADFFPHSYHIETLAHLERTT
ncbi:MAG: class I SAM-dependent RNA methyltransferase [Bdellovibrionota bacterium]